MKKENLEKAKKAIDETQRIEFVLKRINHQDPYSPKWDWESSSLNPDFLVAIKSNMTSIEKECLKALKDAMTTILKEAAERTLAEINEEIKEM